MPKNKKEFALSSEPQIDERPIFTRISEIIESRKSRAGAYANREVTLMFWEVGRYINSVILGNERAEYGKKIVSSLATQLVEKFGRSFELRNLRRMMQFAEYFVDFEIVSTLSTQLAWSHIIELLPLGNNDARLYYAEEAAERRLSTKELRNQISRKAFERREIANTQLANQSAIPFNVFKDPYLLDTLGLKENFLEADLEKAILVELEKFILEFGRGFAFVERQKRMIIDGDDVVLDLLFYHRHLRRLVAVELKMGAFKAEHMGQMALYLKWLNRYERQEWEEAPVGLILCATAKREKIELLELEKAGIAVAEFWTHLPPKAEFEKKIAQILAEAKERLARRKTFPLGKTQKQIKYFFDPKDDEEGN
ncbi:MAG: PDDEXK nuclease domain-containing protein [Firmicutes bacterium]|nr:PDDEXK nuclease domain-containing protein [Bacillota bacterium]